MASQLVPAYEKASGRKVMVPEHWIDHPRLGAGLVKKKPSGVNPGIDRTNPDAPGASSPHTDDEIAAIDSDSVSDRGNRRSTSAPAGTATNTPQE